MGIKFKSEEKVETPVATAPVAEVKDEIAVVEQYDIVADREKMNEELVNSEEVDALVSTIEIDNLESIVNFGADVATNISKASDVVLNSMDMTQLDGTGELMKALAEIMSKFDVKEVENEPNMLQKLFTNMEKQIEKIMHKYNTMGNEIDRIYIQLKQYESEIKQSNKNLSILFDNNVEYYHDLVKYILAGEQACKEIKEYLEQKQKEFEETGDTSLQFEINNLNQALSMMEQRTYDLRTAENVAMQSIPMIKTMEFSNYNLVRKINSAFIITLPVFKQALAQAILLKRQKIQAESLSALDKKTNEMLIKNAQNNMEVTKQAARLASGSTIKIDTLEKTWQTITSGIAETKQIEEEARSQRNSDKVRLEALKNDFMSTYNKK